MMTPDRCEYRTCDPTVKGTGTRPASLAQEGGIRSQGRSASDSLAAAGQLARLSQGDVAACATLKGVAARTTDQQVPSGAAAQQVRPARSARNSPRTSNTAISQLNPTLPMT